MPTGGHQQSIDHHFWRLKYTELNEIFAFMSLRSFALALVAIFIPIYLYLQGYGLKGVFEFYLVMFLVELVLENITAIGIKSFGPKHMIAFSVPFLLLHLFMLLTIPTYHWPLWLVASLGGTTLALYWQSYHYDFSRAKHRRKTSSEVGRIYILLAFVGASAPFIGGYMATNYGMAWVYGTVIFLLILGVLTLFKTSDSNFRPGKLDFSDVKISHFKRDMVAYGGNMLEVCATGQIWPLFLFLLVGSYEKVGLITSAALIVTVGTTYYVSVHSDKENRVKYIKAGGFLSGITSLLKAFVATVPQAFGINIAKSISASVFTTPFISEYYIHADEEFRSEYIYLMESSNDLAKVIYYSVLLALLTFMPEESVLVAGLLIGALGAFISMTMPAAKCEICGQIGNTNIKLNGRVAR